jgi:hypothetical protein
MTEKEIDHEVQRRLAIFSHAGQVSREVETMGLEPTTPCLQTKPDAVHDSSSSSVDVSNQGFFSDPNLDESW